jgi:antitoxin component YwqK of YwqJK toxin-antitoxin module
MDSDKLKMQLIMDISGKILCKIFEDNDNLRTLPFESFKNHPYKRISFYVEDSDKNLYLMSKEYTSYDKLFRKGDKPCQIEYFPDSNKKIMSKVFCDNSTGKKTKCIRYNNNGDVMFEIRYIDLLNDLVEMDLFFYDEMNVLIDSKLNYQCHIKDIDSVICDFMMKYELHNDSEDDCDCDCE